MELEIRWEDDWDLGCSHAQFYCEEAYPNGEPTTCETCMVLSEGVVLASLGCIDDATPEYRKFIESELLDEAKGVLLADHAEV